MKKLLFLFAVTATLLSSCSSNDESVTQEEVNLLLEHYKTTSVLFGTAFIANENGASEAFVIPAIDGFEFEQGFYYNITATKETIKNAGTNATTTTYALVSVNAQDPVPPETYFSMPLAKFVNGIGYVTWVVGNSNTGYVINNEITMDCVQFCTELYSMLAIKDNITGTFEHGPEGTYVLTELY